MAFSEAEGKTIKTLCAVNCGEDKQPQILNSECCLKGFLEVPEKTPNPITYNLGSVLKASLGIV